MIHPSSVYSKESMLSHTLSLLVVVMLLLLAPSSAFNKLASPFRVLSQNSRRVSSPTTSLRMFGSKKKASPLQPEVLPVKEQKKGFGIGQLLQLISMGAGAPMLGEFERIDESGRAIFKLEANNLVDADGNVIQTRARNFNEGYTAGSADGLNEPPPTFFANLLSGGRLMAVWDEKNRVTK